VGGRLAVTQVLAVSPGPRVRPKPLAVRSWRRPRPGHKVEGFGAFGGTAAAGSWREHKIRIGEPGELRTVFF